MVGWDGADATRMLVTEDGANELVRRFVLSDGAILKMETADVAENESRATADAAAKRRKTRRNRGVLMVDSIFVASPQGTMYAILR